MYPASLRTKAAAELELRKRRGNGQATHPANQSLLSFIQYTYPAYVADPFHALVAETLDRVISGDILRLMIFAPPQHGKSSAASVHFPAYWLGRRPDDPLIISSYGAELANSMSRQVRDLVEGDEYRNVFPGVNTRRDSRAVNAWELAGKHRGKLIAVGTGGPVTGKGGMLGIIDDPFKDWAEAQSTTTRNAVDDWYRGTFRPRIWEGGAIVLIATRWHADDLAGRIMAREPGQWHILRLPAIAESQADRDMNNKYLGLPEGEPDKLGRAEGEPLSPRRYSIDALLQLKSDVGSMVWNAEYQGVPRPAEGNHFKRHWFPIVDAAPADARRARYWDKAGTEGGTGAATAGVLIAIGADNLIYIDHVVQGHYSTYQREQVIQQTAHSDAAKHANTVQIYIEREPGSGGLESSESTIAALMGYPIHDDRPTGSKDVRLEPFRAQAEAGKVRLVRGLWNEAYIDEMSAIPNGARRDQADATAGAFNKLALGRRIIETDGIPALANYRG